MASAASEYISFYVLSHVQLIENLKIDFCNNIGNKSRLHFQIKEI